MDQLPLEILTRITSHLNVSDAARTRRVSTTCKAACEANLAKLKIIYYAPDKRDWLDIAPWIDLDEFEESYSCQEWNTVYSCRARGFSPRSMQSLITFIAKYVTSIEAFICNHHIPFEYFVNQLGSKMRFFTGKFGYDWDKNGYEILKRLPKLEQFPLDCYHPCFAKQLEYLPLKVLSYSRADKCCDCLYSLLGQQFTPGQRVKVLLCNDEHEALETCDCKNEGVDGSFAENIKFIHVETATIDSNEPVFIFNFPNLEKFYADYVDISFDTFFTSLSHSNRLKQVFFQTQHPQEAVTGAMRVLHKFTNLEVLMIVSDLDADLATPRDFIATMVDCCPKLKRIQLPFSDLDWIAGYTMRKLRYLRFFECRKVTENFLTRYLTGLHPSGPRELTIIHGRGPNIATITELQLHEIIGELFLTERLKKITVNYFDFDCKSKSCVVKQVLSIP